VLVYSIVGAYGLANLLLCTMMAGVILVLMGLLRMGNLIKFIPYPVTAGFTTGIAVLIFSTQLPDFLGIASREKPPGEFVERLGYLARHIGDVDWHTAALAAASLLLIALWPKRWSRYLPAPIVALVGATIAVVVLRLDVATIGSTFGGIPASLPHLHFPQFEWSAVQKLIQPAITIAMLAAIESLLSAVVADGMIGDRHNSNQELVAQGVANFVSPLFGGIPATGAIARTATNIRNGARSPVAGLIHAVTLLAIMLAAAPLAKHIPLAVLSAILMVVAWNMAHRLRAHRARRSYRRR
jgi:SulP family sulfate permease